MLDLVVIFNHPKDYIRYISTHILIIPACIANSDKPIQTLQAHAWVGFTSNLLKV